MSPKVSVIVPCWGVEKFLDKCVESLVNQTLRDIEIILVDDVSPDRVPEMCDAWAEKDARIKVIHKQKNGGLGFARNTGLQGATGDFVMFIDSDDTYEQDACEKMYNAAISKNADVVTGNFIFEKENGALHATHEEGGSHIVENESIRDYILNMVAGPPHDPREHIYPVSVCLLCIRRAIIQQNKIQFYSEREVASEDTLFKIMLLQKCKKMVCLDFPFYHYYCNDSSLTHSFKESAFSKLKSLRTLMIGLLGRDNDSLNRINRFIISDIRMHVTRLAYSNESNKLQIIKSILSDSIWDELKQYTPSYYGLYARGFYQLVLWNKPRLLLLYSTLTAKLRLLLSR